MHQLRVDLPFETIASSSEYGKRQVRHGVAVLNNFVFAVRVTRRSFPVCLLE